MKILTRYLITEFLKPLFGGISAFSGLVMISEFFRELNYYLEKKTSFVYVFLYLFFNLPWYVIQVLPVAVLLALLFSMGQLARQGEITAMKAAGVNLWRLAATFVFCGVLIGVAEILMRETVIPYTVQQAEKIKQDKIKAEKSYVQTEFYDMVVSLPSEGRMTLGYLNAPANCANQIVIDYYDERFNLRKQIVARSGTFSEAQWHFSDGVERSFARILKKEERFAEKSVKLPFKPMDFVVVKLRPEQMTTAAYRKYINQIKNLGIPSTTDQIQYYLRTSSAFSHIIVMLIGIPFALGLGSRQSKIISFTFALLFAFIYWGVQAIGQSLGENQVVSPLAAAWLGNILFGIAGVFLISRIEK